MNDNIRLNGSKANKISKNSYISGYVGAFFIILSSFIGYKAGIADGNFKESALFIIATIGLIMFIIELINRKTVEKHIVTVSNRITQKNYVSFIFECLIKYLLDMICLYSVFLFYKYTNEYGYIPKNDYYEPFFTVLHMFLKGYLYFGFFYIFITRYLQYDSEADKKELSYLLFKILMKFLKKTSINKKIRQFNFLNYTKDNSFDKFTYIDKSTVLGLFVKIFFVPLISVFFVSQYQHLVSNWGYIENLIKTNSFGKNFSTSDFHNLSFSVIFSIDVGIAWAGYVISSRWIRNTNVSTEPTFLGWFVALSCYPPFQNVLSTYFSIPSETSFFDITNATLVGLFTVMSTLSYLVYMSATMYFGIRFSNLTHRGIISKGPYSIIRHPAYASKNFSWWCVMLPSILYNAFFQYNYLVLVQIFGLIFMTFFYYQRAMTEERHLRMDPEYLEYCKKVPYKFIPKVF